MSHEKRVLAPARVIIRDCTFTAEHGAVNEHMRSAVEALARACEANAHAILEAAKVLAEPPVRSMVEVNAGE